MEYYKQLFSYYYSKNVRYLKSFTPYTLEVVSPTDVTLSWLQWALKGDGETPRFPNHKLISFTIGDKLKGGLASDITRLHLEWQPLNENKAQDEQPPATILVKSLRQAFVNFRTSLTMGTQREAWFYKNWKSLDLGIDLMPECYHATVSADGSNYLLLLEDLSGKAYNGCVLLGNQCWGDPTDVVLPENLGRFTFDKIAMLEKIFVSMAEFHSKTWRRQSLLKNDNLKFVKWLRGEDRDSWELGIRTIRRKWEYIKNNIIGKTAMNWSPLLLKTMETALANTNWETFQATFNVVDINQNTNYCLVHGDFHAGNLLWNGTTNPAEHEKHPFYLIDWPESGVFCPFTDLAQFMISNVEISWRQMNEEALFRMYWSRLVDNGVINKKTASFNACYERYKYGGIERWLQMVTLMAPSLPEFATAFFHDQVVSFIEDHKDTIDMSQISLMTSYPLADLVVGRE